MAKISPIASKYIVHTSIKIDGMVDRPDVIGAVFGQTEGLLGNELELRELQRSGKIGRIEVNLDNKGGKTQGEIIIPSSLDKTETAIIGAALEVIERIGPCNSEIRVLSIEDVRISKRRFVVDRAKELLYHLTTDTLPDSQELSSEVSESVRMMEITTYGRSKLPCGPDLKESDEIIIVEGRADVLTMLRHGFKNVISMNGSNAPKELVELTKTKTTTVFVDGDRGGDLNIRELLSVADIDFTCKAPDGKEVEELTKKEIHKCLRNKVNVEQEIEEEPRRKPKREDKRERRTRDKREDREDRRKPKREKRAKIDDKHKEMFKQAIEDLVGTHAACIYDKKYELLGKVPITELNTTVKSLKNKITAIVMNGAVSQDTIETAEKSKAQIIVGTKIQGKSAELSLLSEADL